MKNPFCKIVEGYLDPRIHRDDADLDRMSIEAFDYALDAKDTDVAQLLFKEKNRLTQVMHRAISASRLERFYNKYSPEFGKKVEALIRQGAQDDSDLSLVNYFIKNRKFYKTTRELDEISKTLFDCALKNKNAAELLFKENNRFIQVMHRTVSPEKLAEFYTKYPKFFEEQVEPLIRTGAELDSALSVVNYYIKNRQLFSKTSQIEDISKTLFNCALANKDAAERLFAENNRFVQVMHRTIPADKFAALFKKCSPEFQEKVKKLTNPGLQAVRPAAPDPIMQLLKLRRQKQDPVAQFHYGRTFMAIQNNPDVIQRNDEHGVMHGTEFIPMVDGNTRNFNKKLCSVGAHRREIIVLDPNDKDLKMLYDDLKGLLKGASTPAKVLEQVKQYTQSCFPGDNIGPFIKSVMETGDRPISLMEFIESGQGVCRHHGLLNAYFISRLIGDGILKGEVVHHRQDFDKGAHTWNIFRGADKMVYSLDSYWNNITCITENPGAINKLYKQKNAEGLIHQHFTEENFREQKGKYQKLVNENDQNRSVSSKITHLKTLIETNSFIVGEWYIGNYRIYQGGIDFKVGENAKRVPHHIYQIYQEIRKHPNYATNSKTADVLWEKIQELAQHALENHSSSRDLETQKIYEDIVKEVSSQKGHGNSPLCM